MTTTRKRTLAGAALLLALSGGLAACGGDDDGGSDAGGSATPSATPSASASAAPGTPTTPTQTAPSAENAAYCDEITVLSQIGSNEGLDNEGAVEQLLTAIKAVAAAAPAEVADEWADVEPAFEKYIRYVADNYIDLDKLPSGVTETQATQRNAATNKKATADLAPVQAQVATIGEHAQTACAVGTF